MPAFLGYPKHTTDPSCMYMNLSNRMWYNDVYGEVSYHVYDSYICQYPSDDSQNKCHEGLLQSGDECYAFGSYLTKTWLKAQGRCPFVGGRLPVIKTAEQSGNLTSLVQNICTPGDNIWLGANRLLGRWMWVDNTPLKYTNWADGECHVRAFLGVLALLFIESFSTVQNTTRTKAQKRSHCLYFTKVTQLT